MNSNNDHLSCLPLEKPGLVCEPGDFPFAAVGLDHGHIHSQCRGLAEAGGTLRWIFDTVPARIEALREKFPAAQIARSEDEVLDDPEVLLVASAAVPSERGPLGCRVMRAGKDFFADKTPFTSLEQLAHARATTAETGRRYMVYYSERLHTEAGVYAGYLVQAGVIGKVLQVIGIGPHRLALQNRPQWFFQKEKYGGILADIGSHQIEQFLYYSGADDATVLHAAVANHANPETPELEDFGEANLAGNNGTTNYFRVDWFTPDSLAVSGDARVLILGANGYIELRNYIDIARSDSPGHVYLANDKVVEYRNVANMTGFPFFGKLILDTLNRTEHAMTQEHAFKAAELCLKAQFVADAKKPPSDFGNHRPHAPRPFAVETGRYDESGLF